MDELTLNCMDYPGDALTIELGDFEGEDGYFNIALHDTSLGKPQESMFTLTFADARRLMSFIEEHCGE